MSTIAIFAALCCLTAPLSRARSPREAFSGRRPAREPLPRRNARSWADSRHRRRTRRKSVKTKVHILLRADRDSSARASIGGSGPAQRGGSRGHPRRRPPPVSACARRGVRGRAWQRRRARPCPRARGAASGAARGIDGALARLRVREARCRGVSALHLPALASRCVASRARPRAGAHERTSRPLAGMEG
jgi:hypothetical protein